MFTLTSRKAWKGVEVHISDNHRRRYYRKNYFSTLAGPVDTTEILLNPGTIVAFTKLADRIRTKFDLRAKLPRARVIKRNGQVGFAFDQAGRHRYFPLKGKDAQARFIVRSVPKKYSRTRGTALES